MNARESAFAKVNLCLFLGAVRTDGRHELVTLFQSVRLRDELRITTSRSSPADEVLCLGVDGPNLVTGALRALRAAGWAAPPVRVEIEKRIPVAAGMGGGSADAAALLRFAPRLAPVSDDVLRELAAGLGSDVPSQLDPGPSLGTGAGDRVRNLPALAAHGLVVVPQRFGLSTSGVYREADRLGLARGAEELAALRSELESALAATASEGSWPDRRQLVNDLEPAALSLAPELGETLELVRAAGAEAALLCGSGPTVIGVYPGAGGLRRAEAAARELRGRFPGAIATAPVARGRYPGGGVEPLV